MRCVARALSIVPFLVLAGCEELQSAMDSERFKEDFHMSYPLAAGSRLDLDNANGSVEVSGWERDTAEVNGTKYASTEQQLRDLKIDISTTNGILRVRTVAGSGLRNYGVRYTIRVPRRLLIDQLATTNGSVRVDGIEGTANVRSTNGAIRVWNFKGPLQAATTNGTVEATAVEGNTTLKTTNGSIRAEASGGAFDATTSNGSINARLDGAATQPVHLESTNGSIDVNLKTSRDLRAVTSNSSITLHLPANASAHVRAHTTSASVESEFEGLKGSTKNSFDGVIGSGGPLITLETHNGHIKVLKQ